jgi:hypothetical protein
MMKTPPKELPNAGNPLKGRISSGYTPAAVVMAVSATHSHYANELNGVDEHLRLCDQLGCHLVTSVDCYRLADRLAHFQGIKTVESL